MITYLDHQRLTELLTWDKLIEALNVSFQEDVEVPIRSHYDVEHSSIDQPSMLLLMPAWKKGTHLGVKMILMSHGNRKAGLDTIQGTYFLMETDTGLPLAMLDAPTLTNLRTAATSALASTYLSRTKSQTLLLLGTGSLAPYMVRAHCAVRPIRKVFIWGRSKRKASVVKEQLQDLGKEILVVDGINSVISDVDIITAATSSPAPLIMGRHIVPGQHLDLAGAYKPDMQEADTEAIVRSRLYIDTPHCLEEAGDLIIPLRRKAINMDHIIGDLPGLTRKLTPGRLSDEDITCFKSVGHASEDLAAASLAFRLSTGN